jgi:hypothetical protein
MDLETSQQPKTICLGGLTVERILEEHNSLLRIRAEFVHDFAEANKMVIQGASRDKIVEWILDMGHISSTVSRWYDKKKTRAEMIAERTMHDIKFTPLRENKLLEDFFARIESYFDRIRPTE